MIAGEIEARAFVEALCTSSDCMARLESFAGLLEAENREQNLVAQSTMPDLWRRHIADSAQLLGHVSRETASWLDVGTGAGFPGLIIAILRPEMAVSLVESRKRRIEWLERASSALDLTNVTVIGKPVEKVETQEFAAISARAFTSLARIADLCARFSTDETCWLLPKGRSAQQELEELAGWRHAFHVEQSATDPEAGLIVGQLMGRNKDMRA